MFHFAHLSPAAEYAWLVFAAFIGGIVNSVAGGGSFLVFPSLLHAGILPVQANATCTVALLPGQYSSGAAYRSELKANMRLIVPSLIAALFGGAAGAWVLLHTPQGHFLRILPWLFLVGAVTFSISGPVSRAMERRRAQMEGRAAAQHAILLALLLLAVCFYIGYFGAGAGFIVMTALSLAGVHRLAQVNALKVIITGTANGVAVISFILGRAVAWHYCAAMMLACALGGYLGAHYSRTISDRALRPAITLFAYALSAYFFWRQYHPA
jgi:hypothetical protein